MEPGRQHKNKPLYHCFCGIIWYYFSLNFAIFFAVSWPLTLPPLALASSQPRAVRGVSGMPLATRSAPWRTPCNLVQVHSGSRQLLGIISSPAKVRWNCSRTIRISDRLSILQVCGFILYCPPAHDTRKL